MSGSADPSSDTCACAFISPGTTVRPASSSTAPSEVEPAADRRDPSATDDDSGAVGHDPASVDHPDAHGVVRPAAWPIARSALAPDPP